MKNKIKILTIKLKCECGHIWESIGLEFENLCQAKDMVCEKCFALGFIKKENE